MQKFKKIYPKCKGKNTKKDGKRRGKQSYKCKACNYVWINKSRKNKSQQAKKLYYQYVIRKRTYSELSKDYGLSKKKIQTFFDNLEIEVKHSLPIGKKLFFLLILHTLATSDGWYLKIQLLNKYCTIN